MPCECLKWGRMATGGFGGDCGLAAWAEIRHRPASHFGFKRPPTYPSGSLGCLIDARRTRNAPGRDRANDAANFYRGKEPHPHFVVQMAERPLLLLRALLSIVVPKALEIVDVYEALFTGPGLELSRGDFFDTSDEPLPLSFISSASA